MELKNLIENSEYLPFRELMKYVFLESSEKYDELLKYAEELYARKIKYVPVTRFLNRLAYSLNRRYKTNLAIKVIQKVIKLEPNNGDYYDANNSINNL